jgi:hypothetical protein
MEAVFPLASDIAYVGQLIGAGWQGATRVRTRPDGPREAGLLTPVAIGAALGALSVRAFGRRKSASTVAIGGMIGTIVGCGAAVAWASRGLVVPAARGAVRCMNAVRDARWLESHPITYA